MPSEEGSFDSFGGSIFTSLFLGSFAIQSWLVIFEVGTRPLYQMAVTVTWVTEARFLLAVGSWEGGYHFICLDGHVVALPTHPVFCCFVVFWLVLNVETVAFYFKGVRGTWQVLMNLL